MILSLPGRPPSIDQEPTPVVVLLRVEDVVLDSLSLQPVVGAYVEAEIINLSGYPGAPSGRSFPMITDQGFTGPQGQFSLDVTLDGQGTKYAVRVNSVDPTGTLFGGAGPYTGS